MREVVLTIGPQGAGKSTFCRKIVQAHPEIKLVNLDDIVTDMFGIQCAPSYSEQTDRAKEKMFDTLAEYLEQPNTRIILDCWNGEAAERIAIIERLRFFGAERVSGWHFVTPEDVCLEWFIEREEAKVPDHLRDEKWKEIRRNLAMSSCAHKYQDYHSQPVSRDQGFSFIKEINPLKPPCFVHLFSPVIPNDQVPLKTRA